MSEKELLQGYLEQERERIFAASANYAMTVPKKGMEEQWRDAIVKEDLLLQMLERMEG